MYNVTDEYKELIQAPVRYTGISGAVRLKSGTVIQLDDGNVDSGSLSIVRKLNGKGDFRPGGVYSSYLSARLRGFAEKTSDLDGAVIRLNYLLYHDSGMDRATAEVVPLGRFYVDGSQIKRRNDVVTIKAADGLMLFDVPATARSGTLYELVCGACQAAKVDFGMTEEEFEALPNATMNATVNTSRIQTEHDLLMYVALATCSFAKMTRQYSRLEFVPLTCQKNSVGVITPVREIDGNIRFSTDFSDDVTRILKLVMRRGGKALTTTYSALPGTTDKMALLELPENPLFSGLSDSEVIHALNAELPGLFECRNRPFSAAFTGDPALDVGDYVRLTGGAIDTARGYATGMITSQIWKYHGQHTIKCEMPSSLSAVDIAETSENGIATYSESTDPPTRIQPKPQLEKRVDWLESQLTVMSAGAALTSYKYLTDLSAQCNGVTYTAEKDTETGLISKISDSAGHVLTPEIPEGITDVAMHNATVFALAMARGLGKETSVTLYDGSDGSARWRGISGFTAIKSAAQARSVVESALYTSGAPRALRLQKVCGIKAGDEYSAMDGYTDAFIARSTEQVDLTGYSRLRIYAAAFSDLAQLTAKVYFDIGSKSAPISYAPYDFTEWIKITDITAYSVNYYQPGVEFGWFEIDLSGIAGRQYINIGVSHGTESPGNTAFFDVQKMILEV